MTGHRILQWLSLLSILAMVFPAAPVQANSPAAPAPVPAVQQVYSPCKNRVNIQEEDMDWLFVPETASQLQTNLPYAFLAGQLIKNKVVNAENCPSGGLQADGYANPCGLAVAKPYTDQVQNMYDEAILEAWRDTGVPPVMLKQLIRYESQFWPGQFGEAHYGLGHLTYYGAITGLTWYPPLRAEICTISGDCGSPLIDIQAMTLLSLMDVTCPTCAMKIDLERARRSVHYLAEVLLGHCYQVSQVVFNVAGIPSSSVVDYATIWKLTLFSYNAGPTCVYEAVNEAYETFPGGMGWRNIRNFIRGDQCIRGETYVDQITERFYQFTQ